MQPPLEHCWSRAEDDQTRLLHAAVSRPLSGPRVLTEVQVCPPWRLRAAGRGASLPAHSVFGPHAWMTPPRGKSNPPPLVAWSSPNTAAACAVQGEACSAKPSTPLGGVRAAPGAAARRKRGATMHASSQATGRKRCCSCCDAGAVRVGKRLQPQAQPLTARQPCVLSALPPPPSLGPPRMDSASTAVRLCCAERCAPT